MCHTISVNDKKAITAYIRSVLPGERYAHTLRVAGFSKKLSARLGADKDKARTAALLHDCAKCMSPEELLSYARRHKIKCPKYMLKRPGLLHGAVAASIARLRFGINDRDILRAISNHTMGRPRMSALEKTLFLADHLEPGRKRKGYDRLRRIAMKDADKAIALFLDEVIQYLKKKGLHVSRRTVLTRDHYKK